MTIMANEMEQFRQIIKNTVDADNNVRTEAEAQYDKIPVENRGNLLFNLAANAAEDEGLRSQSFILLRRLLSQSWEEIWPKWGGEGQKNFKDSLLQATKREESEIIRKRLADVVAEVARNCLDTDESQWTEVLNFLHECITSTEENLQSTGLTIFENCPAIFGSQQQQYLNVIKEMLEHSLKSANQNVRTGAVRAATAFICDNEDDQSVLTSTASLIPLILAACESVVTGGEEDDTPLQCLGDLATSVPKALKNNLNDTCQLCLKVCGTKEIDDALRHSALEVLVSLCESNAPMMRKRGAEFIPPLIQCCMELMVDLEDDADWHTADAEDVDDDNNAAVGETSLDRVATSLGGKTVFPPCIALIPTMMQNENWQYRHAGLMALSTIGEGCKKSMEAKIVDIISSIVPFLQDPHPRVRYAACNALGQMSTDFAPTIEKKCHDKIIPGLLMALEDMGNPRVAAHAAAALVNFAEDCPKNILVSYLDGIMQKLEWALQQTFKMLEAGKKLVLEQVVTTIASVADTAESHYIEYYDRVMPSLKYILENAVQPELRLLRGKVIECVSLIGLAVGTEKFAPDASEVMNLLLNSQAKFGESDDADDPSTSYIISASARICKLLGEGFAQYLPVVMPAVLKAAEFKPDVTVLDSADAENIDTTEDSEWTYVGVGDQSMLGIKTAGLEDKANACQMIVCYARELKTAFADYVEPVTKLMVPLLKFYFHEGVRSAAAECLPFLLQDGQGKGNDFVREMWEYIFPDLLKAAETEPENEVLADHLYSLSKCVEFLGAGCLDEKKMQSVFDLLKKLLDSHFEKAEERNKQRTDEDHDEEQETELQDEDEEDSYVVSKVSDVVHAIFSTHGKPIVPYFNQLLPHMQKMMEPGRAYGDRQWALCLFDDLIEFAEDLSFQYHELFIPCMMKSLLDEHAEVRQAAAYGFGVMGLQGRPEYAPACAAALPVLGQLIEAEGSRDTAEAMGATENSISAVTKILKNNAAAVPDLSPYISRFLMWLPVWDDKEESPYIYGYFCDLIESNNPMILGDNNANLPRIVLVIATAFEKDAFDETGNEVAFRMTNLIRSLQQNEEVLNACVKELPESSQSALKQAIERFTTPNGPAGVGTAATA